MKYRKIFTQFVITCCIIFSFGFAETTVKTPERQIWSFGGINGAYDKLQLRRGLQVYEEKCRACHSMEYLEFRTLTLPGGPELSDKEAKEIAESYSFKEILDDGQETERVGNLLDSFSSPYLNEQEAKYLNNGKVPADLSYITRARSYDRGFPQFLFDLFLPYGLHGSDYVYAILTGYEDNSSEYDPFVFNYYFPGGMIGMKQQLHDGDIEYHSDIKGSPPVPQTAEQYAKDVTAFLSWVSDPNLENRQKIGKYVFVYLFIFLGLLLCLYFRRKNND